MTRERLAPVAVMQAAYGVLDKYKISRTFFVKTNQADCGILPLPVDSVYETKSAGGVDPVALKHAEVVPEVPEKVVEQAVEVILANIDNNLSQIPRFNSVTKIDNFPLSVIKQHIIKLISTIYSRQHKDVPEVKAAAVVQERVAGLSPAEEPAKPMPVPELIMAESAEKEVKISKPEEAKPESAPEMPAPSELKEPELKKE